MVLYHIHKYILKNSCSLRKGEYAMRCTSSISLRECEEQFISFKGNMPLNQGSYRKVPPIHICAVRCIKVTLFWLGFPSRSTCYNVRYGISLVCFCQSVDVVVVVGCIIFAYGWLILLWEHFWFSMGQFCKGWHFWLEL